MNFVFLAILLIIGSVTASQDLTGYFFYSSCGQIGTFISGKSRIESISLCQDDFSACSIQQHMNLVNAVVQLQEGHDIRIQDNENIRIQSSIDANGDFVASSHNVLLRYKAQDTAGFVFTHNKCLSSVYPCLLNRFENKCS
jgi:hypothetical protein